MNPIITVLLEVYARKLKLSKKPITNEIKILQKMKNGHMDHYLDAVRRLCSLNDPTNYQNDLDEVVDEIEKHEYIIIEVLREMIEKL